MCIRDRPKNDFMIKGHKSHLILLFQNLISNGIKYQNDNTTPIIKINAVHHHDQILISITDNGIGISEQYFDVIMQPFKRLHTNEEFSGTGIGLATCKKILSLFDSKLTIASKVNEGSTFSFYLPTE